MISRPLKNTLEQVYQIFSGKEEQLAGVHHRGCKFYEKIVQNHENIAQVANIYQN